MRYIILLTIILVLIPKLVIFLGLFQQNGYKINKYMINLKKHYFKTFTSYLEYISIIMLILFSFYEKWYIGVLTIITLLLVVLFSKKLIIYPKITKRLMRLLITTLIIFVLIILLFKNSLWLFLVCTVFSPLMIILASIINHPIEQLISKYYKLKAAKKLNLVKPLIIGITGSYGKTSTKNIIHNIICEQYYTYSSPKSYNTPMGLSKAIEEMNTQTEVFISELGATKPSDIKELVDFIKVDIGVITDIGCQHLETFKTIDAVLKTKLEILESKNIKTIVINNDNNYLKEFKYPPGLKVIRIGLTTESDYLARNIELTMTGITFDVFLKDKYITTIKTNLLGRHNIYNLLFGIVIGIELKVDIKTIKNKIAEICSVNNRLSISNVGNIKILNDAFNSNVIGFKNAVEVLKLTKNKKILITPGIVDLGDSLKDANIEVGKTLIEGIDYIYLIKNEAAIHLANWFEERGFKDFEVMTSFKDAYHQAIKKYNESTILIENDLPDNYLRR